MSQGTKLREETSTARTIGTQNNKGMWCDPPLGEVGSHFHWTPLNCPRGRQKPSNSTQGLKCKMPTVHRPNTTEFTGVSYFLDQKPNCVWSENSRHLFGCYFRSNVNTCLLNCRLRDWKQKELIIRSARRIKPPGIFVNEDLAQETLDKREEQRPKFEEARRNGKIAYFVLDRLVIKDRIERPS